MVSKVRVQETRAAQDEPVTKCNRYNIPNCLKVTRYTSSYGGKIHISRFDACESTIQCHQIHSRYHVAVTTNQTKLHHLPQKPHFHQLPYPSPRNQHTFISVKVTTQGPSCRQESLPAVSGFTTSLIHVECCAGIPFLLGLSSTPLWGRAPLCGSSVHSSTDIWAVSSVWLLCPCGAMVAPVYTQLFGCLLWALTREQGCWTNDNSTSDLERSHRTVS